MWVDVNSWTGSAWFCASRMVVAQGTPYWPYYCQYPKIRNHSSGFFRVTIRLEGHRTRTLYSAVWKPIYSTIRVPNDVGVWLGDRDPGPPNDVCSSPAPPPRCRSCPEAAGVTGPSTGRAVDVGEGGEGSAVKARAVRIRRGRDFSGWVFRLGVRWKRTWVV